MVASVVLLSSTWSTFAHAALATVDCGKKGGIQAALDKFDKSLANSLTLVGTCTEVVTVSGHRDLTIIGGPGVSLTAPVAPVQAIATLRILGSPLPEMENWGGKLSVYLKERRPYTARASLINAGLTTRTWLMVPF